MTYYYKINSNKRSETLSDDWMKFHKPASPKEVFEKRNNIKIWWHVNDISGKVDMNINMANKTIRKKHKNM